MNEATDIGERNLLEFRANVLGLYLLIGSAVSVLITPLYFYVGINLLTAACAVYGMCMVLVAVLFRRGSLGLQAATDMFLLATVSACMCGLYLGDELVDNKSWQLVIPVAAFTVVGWRKGLLWCLCALGVALAIIVLRWPRHEMLSVLAMTLAYLTITAGLCAFNRHNETNIRTIARLSHTDPLTGVYNRQLLEELSNSEFKRSLRAEEPLAIYMLDIDHFKKFNDRYGHVAGDSALAAVATVIRNSARRASDLVFRYGGEEFCVVCSAIEEKDALTLADAIVEGVRAAGIVHADGENGVLTISVGLSHQARLVDTDAQRILESADVALYQAKQSGSELRRAESASRGWR